MLQAASRITKSIEENMLSVFVFVSVLFTSSSGDLCKIERFPLHSVSSVSDCTIKEEKVHTQTTKKKKKKMMEQSLEFV